jgi:hypothetical protein
MIPDPSRPRPAPSSAPGAWPARCTSHRAGTGCPMCQNDFDAEDIGWGLLVRRGEVSNAYLWRSGQVRGYAVVIYTGRHVAEPTELDAREAAAFWRDVLAMGRAVEAFYKPLKMNYLLLGNQIPHAFLGRFRSVSFGVPRGSEDQLFGRLLAGTSRLLTLMRGGAVVPVLG